MRVQHDGSMRQQTAHARNCKLACKLQVNLSYQQPQQGFLSPALCAEGNPLRTFVCMRHPLPYDMCSREECDDRVRWGEVSAFEGTDDTSGLPPNRRRLDPSRAVAKYRRSAAGGSSADRYPLRSAEQLDATVRYLLEVLAERRPPHNTSSHGPEPTTVGQPRESLLTTVAFVEDRIRAVQVDLVKLRQPSPTLQVLVARCHILILYLTADCPHYERQFGYTALQTALLAYREAAESHQPRSEDTENRVDYHDKDVGDKDQDEMHALAVVYQLGQVLMRASDSGTTPLESSALSLASSLQRMAPHQESPQVILPRFLWSLSLVVEVLLGHWHIALQMLRQGPPSSSGKEALGTLSRCLLAPCLVLLRRQCIEVNNAAFRKGEAVSSVDVARLLQFDGGHGEAEDGIVGSTTTWDEDSAPPGLSESETACLAFGRALGLPQDSQHCLVFKTARVRSVSNLSHFSVRDDAFVLRLHPRDMIPDGDGVLLPTPDWLRTVLRSPA